MSNAIKKIQCRLSGVRPLMMDRYAGDNSTKLPTAEKMYLKPDGSLYIPAINIYSLLCAENTKSVCKHFFGKVGKSIALGISSYTTIDPNEIPLLDDSGVIKYNGEPILPYPRGKISEHVIDARLKNGLPNHKIRPCLALPWYLEFTITYCENRHCTIENLRQALEMGGILGVGTFRPFFGRYQLVKFEVGE
jgi:hypothetical protein